MQVSFKKETPIVDKLSIKEVCLDDFTLTVNNFINGISRDLTAVKNAIIYDYNNGLAEGSVNKLKVIKRIMYERCNFETFRRKVLRLELRR